MGLDVKVFKNVKSVSEEEAEQTASFRGFLPYKDWKNRMSNLEEGKWYTGEIEDPDIGYGYDSHTWFRNYLATVLLDKPIKYFYDIEWVDNTPFAEFINFSDCEGCIDWEMSKKLYNDFVEWKDRMFNFYKTEKDTKYEFNRQFQTRYNNWLNAFKVASENMGVVVYG